MAGTSSGYILILPNILPPEKWKGGGGGSASPAPLSLSIALHDCFGDAITSCIGYYEVGLVTGQDSSPITGP